MVNTVRKLGFKSGKKQVNKAETLRKIKRDSVNNSKK